MSEFDFADRYAEAGLRPSAEIIAARQATAARIGGDLGKQRLLDLVSAYYGVETNLDWLRDELRKEDPTFSLVSNRREGLVLAAAMLGAKVAEGDAVAILAVVAGSIQGKRGPTEAGWLLDAAHSAMSTQAAAARVPREVSSLVKSVAAPKLAEEITAAGVEPAALSQLLGKVRSESQDAIRSVARQVNDALQVLSDNADFQREETQILWWLFGEHSRSLGRHFGALRPAQAALVGGIELGELTTASALGPVAAPAVLDRVLRGAKKEGKAQPTTLQSAVDGLGADLGRLVLLPPARAAVCPVLTALGKAREIGVGSWAAAFNSAAGLVADTGFDAAELARQVYHEHLLGLA